MTKINVGRRMQIMQQVTHVECVSCQVLIPLAPHNITMQDESEVEDLYDVLDCCDDPCYLPVIVCPTPLFPEDDKDSSLNQDSYHYGLKQYHYTVNDDFFDAVEEQEQS